MNVLMRHKIELPERLSREYLAQTFGKSAADFYLSRIEDRAKQGHIYHNPIKTAYLWMVEDKQRRAGYWLPAANRQSRAKNHGKS